MFNIDRKKEFLEDVRRDTNLKSPETTSQAYGRVFTKTESIEKRLDKDLYNFTLDEISEFFWEKKPSTKNSARTIGRIITKYINWAIGKGYSVYLNKKENPLDVKQDYFNDFVKDDNRLYLTIDEVRDTVDYLVNYQDAVLVALLFNGVQGKEASEIRNLTIDDVDTKKCTLRLLDDKHYDKEKDKYSPEAHRIVDLTNDQLNTIKLIRNAYLEQEYIKKNGEMEQTPQVKDSVELPAPYETAFIIKTGKTQQLHYGERASQYTVYNRLDMIRTLEGLKDYSERLITKNIVRSGMIYEAKRLLEEQGGELDNSKLEEICSKFNVKNHWAVRDFINMDVIKSLYGDIKITETRKVM